eukprot:scaffold355_cov211-Pinguiococcus_pyrenoidosus.AAC.1
MDLDDAEDAEITVLYNDNTPDSDDDIADTAFAPRLQVAEPPPSPFRGPHSVIPADFVPPRKVRSVLAAGLLRQFFFEASHAEGRPSCM